MNFMSLLAQAPSSDSSNQVDSIPEAKWAKTICIEAKSSKQNNEHVSSFCQIRNMRQHTNRYEANPKQQQRHVEDWILFLEDYEWLKGREKRSEKRGQTLQTNQRSERNFPRPALVSFFPAVSTKIQAASLEFSCGSLEKQVISCHHALQPPLPIPPALIERIIGDRHLQR